MEDDPRISDKTTVPCFSFWNDRTGEMIGILYTEYDLTGEQLGVVTEALKADTNSEEILHFQIELGQMSRERGWSLRRVPLGESEQ